MPLSWWRWKWKSHFPQSFNQPTSSFSFQAKNHTQNYAGKVGWETDGLFKGWVRHTEVCWIQTFVNNCFFGSCIKVCLLNPNVCLNSTFCWFLNKHQGSLEFPCLFLCFFSSFHPKTSPLDHKSQLPKLDFNGTDVCVKIFVSVVI